MASVRESVSRFGKFLSSMVMPNIGAFIAWGFLTALFIDTGWLPNPAFSSIVGPMLSYLIPILIAGQGGEIVGGKRGRVIASIAIVGAIVGSEYTMLMGAMLVGPLAGWIIKKWDAWSKNWTPAGFEMLVDNFSLGILGLLLTLFSYVAIGPFMGAILTVLTAGVQVLTNLNLVPLLAIFIEPAKVLFLNNAINHGIFTPIGTTQVAEMGKSIMFMLEANPGPGLGVLLAYMFFSKDKTTRQSAPGAVIIHFLGGIHEIYFPYVLMNPAVIIAPIVGNIAAIFWFSLTGCGLVAPASPGSIVAFMSMSAPCTQIMTLIGVAIAAAVSFLIAAPIVRRADVKDLSAAQAEVSGMKAAAAGTAAAGSAAVTSGVGDKIIFACDAGMGSSAMGATRFRNRIKLDRPDCIVEHSSVDEVPADANIVVVQRNLAARAQACAPNAQFVIIDNFLADPALDQLYTDLVAQSAAAGVGEIADEAAPAKAETAASAIAIDREGIKLGCPSVTKEEAIQASGELLMAHGAVDADYVAAMQERERVQTVYMGMGVAIPHGTNDVKDSVKKTCVTLHQYPDGIEWGGEKAYLVFGLAGANGEHLQVLANIAKALEDEDVVEKMKTTTDVDWLLSVLS
ncbi:MAG: PTS mannitol transporter subunit IICBA [Atopobiaceae bacterium]|nr:PTS mannitol transporter subunit IICBA [Atopobiaceae bacterium]